MLADTGIVEYHVNVTGLLHDLSQQPRQRQLPLLRLHVQSSVFQPASSISLMVSSALLLAMMTTSAPALARPIATVWPIPRPPPVTIATFPDQTEYFV